MPRRGIVLDLVGIVLLVFVVTKIWELFGPVWRGAPYR